LLSFSASLCPSQGPSTTPSAHPSPGAPPAAAGRSAGASRLLSAGASDPCPSLTLWPSTSADDPAFCLNFALWPATYALATASHGPFSGPSSLTLFPL
jgi:hypothetical protein